MIIRDTDKRLFINAKGIYGVRRYDSDLIVDFNGFRIELPPEEMKALWEALCHLNSFPNDSLVFEDVGKPSFPEYKMMKWYYDRDTNKGGPIEIQSLHRTMKRDET